MEHLLVLNVIKQNRHGGDETTFLLLPKSFIFYTAEENRHCGNHQSCSFSLSQITLIQYDIKGSALYILGY